MAFPFIVAGAAQLFIRAASHPAFLGSMLGSYATYKVATDPKFEFTQLHEYFKSVGESVDRVVDAVTNNLLARAPEQLGLVPFTGILPSLPKDVSDALVTKANLFSGMNHTTDDGTGASKDSDEVLLDSELRADRTQPSGAGGGGSSVPPERPSNSPDPKKPNNKLYAGVGLIALLDIVAHFATHGEIPDALKRVPQLLEIVTELASLFDNVESQLIHDIDEYNKLAPAAKKFFLAKRKAEFIMNFLGKELRSVDDLEDLQLFLKVLVFTDDADIELAKNFMIQCNLNHSKRKGRISYENW